MRVLHAFPTWLPQTQTWMHNQIRWLPPEIENHVLCERTEHLDQFGLPNIHSFDERPRPLQAFDRVARGLRLSRTLPSHALAVRAATRPAVAHSHFGDVGWRMSRSFRGLPHAVTFYGYDVGKLPREAGWPARYRRLWRRAQAFLCEGPFMRTTLLSLGAPPEKTFVQRLAVDLDRLPYRRRTVCGSRINVIMSSSFREKKGISYGLEALERLTALGADVRLTLVGGPSAGHEGEAERVARLVARAPYPIVRPGYVAHQQLLDMIAQSDVLLAPSITAKTGDTEGGCPVTILEAAALGVPVVSTRHADIPAALVEPVMLSEERDVAGLVKALTWLLDNDPGEWTAPVRSNLEVEYAPATQGRRLADVYRRLAG